MRALSRMDQGMTDRHAYGGRVLAVDLTCADLVRRAQSARDRSDDAVRAAERRQKEAADLAARGGRP